MLRQVTSRPVTRQQLVHVGRRVGVVVRGDLLKFKSSARVREKVDFFFVTCGANLFN